jgi:hypothetical protein
MSADNSFRFSLPSYNCVILQMSPVLYTAQRYIAVTFLVLSTALTRLKKLKNQVSRTNNVADHHRTSLVAKELKMSTQFDRRSKGINRE